VPIKVSKYTSADSIVSEVTLEFDQNQPFLSTSTKSRTVISSVQSTQLFIIKAKGDTGENLQRVELRDEFWGTKKTDGVSSSIKGLLWFRSVG
jgi:hypothetical protein